MKKYFRNQQRGKGEYLILFFIIIFSTVIAGGIQAFRKQPKPDPNKPTAHFSNTTSAPSRQSLQIDTPISVTLTPIAITPVPSSTDTRPFCGEDTITPHSNACRCQEDEVSCQNGVKQIVYSPFPYQFNPYPSGSDSYNNWVTTNTQRVLGLTDCSGGNGNYCLEKPVIYLYPKEKTLVDVNLIPPGIVTKSIPEYKDGWRHIVAFPDGTLKLNEKIYAELYYESSVKKISPPDNGLIIPMNELKNQLPYLAKKFGLNDKESKEFSDYWLSSLLDLKSNYILFSVFTLEEKEKIDKVTITPKPATFIQFLAYFKPLDFPIAIPPLSLPKSPPARIGFTAVEWGGTIDATSTIY